MKKNVVFAGIISMLLVFGMVLTGCDNGSTSNDDDDNGKGGDDGVAKSLTVTGLDAYNGAQYQIGIASSIEKLLKQDVVAYADGTISATTSTALKDAKSNAPWTGTGSYYVGVVINGTAYGSKTAKSFSSAVTTLSIADFDKAQ